MQLKKHQHYSGNVNKVKDYTKNNPINLVFKLVEIL